MRNGRHESQKAMMKKYGFTMDYIVDESSDMTNIHTHGIKETFNHPDLQIVIAIEPDIALDIFIAVIQQIKEGCLFKPGYRYYGVLECEYEVEFIYTSESGGEILRIILPDEQGNFPSDRECDPAYRIQLDL